MYARKHSFSGIESGQQSRPKPSCDSSAAFQIFHTSVPMSKSIRASLSNRSGLFPLASAVGFLAGKASMPAMGCCFAWWRRKLSCLLNPTVAYLQNAHSHLKGLSCLCVMLWRRRSFRSLNCLPHSSHLFMRRLLRGRFLGDCQPRTGVPSIDAYLLGSL